MIQEPDRSTRAVRLRQALSSPQVVLWLASSVLLAFLLIPLAAIFIRAVPSGAFTSVLDEEIVHEALKLSLVTTLITLVITVVFGTPVAYLLARYEFRGKRVIDSLVDLPMVLPPAVAGVAMLMAFGRRGILGPWLSDWFGLEIPFTTLAVMMAQTFVAVPFFIRSAKAGFERVDPEIEHVSATLGISRLQTFFSVTVPLSLPALMSGAVMAWARALGEFGATIMFAGNFMGRTQTMPLAIYQAMESGDLDASLALSGILIIVSFSVLIAFRWLTSLVPGGGSA
jgi:molybdate transport system permease protein